MKNIHSTVQTKPALGNAWQPPLKPKSQTSSKRTILLGVMIPTMAIILNLSMFGVALPTIRTDFQIRADVVGWLVTAYTLPFMISMPLYGRLGDQLGKRRLFLIGMITFFTGLFISFIAPNLYILMLGRVIQGFGSASSVPLSMAIISQRFPPTERGRALATWNSIGPATGLAGPLMAGLLVDYLSWRAIYIPVMGVSLVAVWIIREKIPHGHTKAQLKVLRIFDWRGVFLLTSAIILLAFYLSSPAITGVAAMYDWRLLTPAILLFTTFIIWEKRCPNPYVDLTVFSNPTFKRASFGAGVRMFVMSGIGFLMPLYLADVYNSSAFITGIVVMVHAGALLATIQIGGQLADRWSSRWPVIVGTTVQVSIMITFALLSGTEPLWQVMVLVVFHGLGAGLALAAFHRASMANVSPEQAGMAAGLYSMTRFTGSMLGPVLGGVILQQGLDKVAQPIEAYHTVFWLIACVGMLGIISGLGLRE